MQDENMVFAQKLRKAGVIAAEPETIRLYREALHLGKINAGLLILGESGTGKDHYAKFVHDNGIRSGKPFVHINCAALPGELFESELFGYEPGSFTGGLRIGKIGVAESADGGTLFLDEIGELEPENQVKLLNFLETKEIRRIGSGKPRHADVRIITATNRDLTQSIRCGAFRPDLFYRIGVVRVNLQPLRSRPKDIIALINAFCERHGEKSFMPDALEYLTSRDWPGNLRELHNFMERLYLFIDTDIVTRDLLEEHCDELFSHLHTSVPQTGQADRELTLREAVADFERAYIAHAINDSPNLAAAAERLGINITTLNRKKRQLGIYSKRKYSK